MQLNGRQIMVACGFTNAAITLYHVGFLAFGMGDEHHPLLPAVTLAVTAICGTFTAYAFSSAGTIRRLPLLKLGLAVPATIFTLYGIALLLQRGSAAFGQGALDWEYVVSGGIIGVGALALGIGHFVGMRTASAPIN